MRPESGRIFSIQAIGDRTDQTRLKFACDIPPEYINPENNFALGILLIDNCSVWRAIRGDRNPENLMTALPKHAFSGCQVDAVVRSESPGTAELKSQINLL